MLKIKDKGDAKSKSPENKKELPPLPNLKLKDKGDVKSKSSENKENKPFKMDTSFLKND